MPSMEVWIEYASTYSYITVARIGRIAAQNGVALEWQPFFLPPVREHQGLGHPFPEASAKKLRTCGATCSGAQPS